jgi:signal peptidase II
MRLIAIIAGLTNQARPVGRKAFGWIAGSVMIADQASKALVVGWLGDRPPVTVLPGLLQIHYRTNTGAAFSILEGHTGVLTLVSLVVSVLVFAWAWRLKPGEQGLRLCFGLILGGAAGNLIDRLRLGYVVDFIDAYWTTHHWPTFNLADSAICVGIFMMIIASLRPVPCAAPASPDQKNCEKRPEFR